MKRKLNINDNLSVIENIAFISIILLPVLGSYLLISRSNKWNLVRFRVHEYIFYVFLLGYWIFYYLIGDTILHSIAISAMACLPVSMFFLFLEESQDTRRLLLKGRVSIFVIILILTMSLAAFQMAISIAEIFYINIDTNPCSPLMAKGFLMSVALFLVLTLTAKSFARSNLLFEGFFEILNAENNDYIYFSLSIFILLLLLIFPFAEDALPNVILVIECIFL